MYACVSVSIPTRHVCVYVCVCVCVCVCLCVCLCVCMCVCVCNIHKFRNVQFVFESIHIYQLSSIFVRACVHFHGYIPTVTHTSNAHLKFVFELIHIIIGRYQCFVSLQSLGICDLLTLFVSALKIPDVCHQRVQGLVQATESLFVLTSALNLGCCVLLQRLEVFLLQKFRNSVKVCVNVCWCLHV
jgi:hypothetical protein